VSSRLAKTWRGGEPFIWLTGGALALALLLVGGLIGLILVNGLGFFWPKDIVRLTLTDGKTMAGQVVERESIPDKPGQHRIKLKVANRDLYGADFQWVDDAQVARREYPAEIAVVERYLPQAMSPEETAKAVEDLLAELQITDKYDLGRAMKEFMARYRGRVDGKAANALIASRLR
jgi:ABC-type phosphate transport system auxiliary subunit